MEFEKKFVRTISQTIIKFSIKLIDMAIQWTPWNVPMHRRFEVFASGFAFFVAIILGPLSFLIMFYLVVR